MALTLLHRSTIPLPATSLVGRDHELARIRAMLADPAVRLVTLTGPGGVGKTRLALQVAHDIDADSDDDVAFVSLASAFDSGAALAAIGSALGIGRPDAAAEHRLADVIGDRHMLLILDNAEQVADHLTPLATILERCRNLTILVTSRVMVRLSAEFVFPIEPLATTSVDAGGDMAPAAALFIERARSVRPDLTLSPADRTAIDEICRDLDGLPLAIELAAARARFLSPAALRARLGERLKVLTGGPRDAPERHQTLRATLEWSHDLLGPAEQTLFRRLAIFEGSAPYDAVAPVCGTDLGTDVDETLAALADHSLVRIFDRPETGARVRMLNTIREFALAQLDASGEVDAVGRAHADWFAALVISTPVTSWRTGTPELREYTMRYRPDDQNFAAMLPRQIASGCDADTVRVVTGLVPFWVELGQWREAREWARRIIPMIDAVPLSSRLQVHYMVSTIEFASDNLDEARHHGELALAMAEASDDQRMIANAQNLLGQIAWVRRDAAEGERLQRAAIETSRNMAAGGAGGALFGSMLAIRLAERGALDEAETLLVETLPEIERGRPEAMPLAQGAMAYLRLLQGDPDRAAAALGESLDFHRDSPDRQPATLAERLVHAAWLATMRSRDRDGARLFGAAEALGDRIGMPVENVCEIGAAETRRVITERLEAAILDDERLAGRSLEIPAAISLAFDVIGDRREPVAEKPDETRETLGLTERQLDVLRLLAEGMSNPAIGEALFISERTVTTHLTRIYDRLDVSTRTEAVARATQLGLTGATPTTLRRPPS